jgi:hypothetical protein
MSGTCTVWQALAAGPFGGPVAALWVRRSRRLGHECGTNLRVTHIPLSETKS